MNKLYILLLSIIFFLYTMGISYLTVKLIQFLLDVGG